MSLHPANFFPLTHDEALSVAKDSGAFEELQPKLAQHRAEFPGAMVVLMRTVTNPNHRQAALLMCILRPGEPEIWDGVGASWDSDGITEQVIAELMNIKHQLGRNLTDQGGIEDGLRHLN